ncbi:hypothetical protein C4K00_2939 [Pseudomonas synxantha]|nr:hypothetical protein C4K00_2939 [Pseudomonas synxantha]
MKSTMKAISSTMIRKQLFVSTVASHLQAHQCDTMDMQVMAKVKGNPFIFILLAPPKWRSD